MTSVASRGTRVRRGGRRPGWVLLTALLVLAIAASSVLVFTSRVELLKLAVIVSLWAAVAAAFASVLYRRQSDADQARAHDLKLVYDLQLDREISARREYELTVESQLRRELAAELRDQAADEVAALRAELSALRANLEILFEADLGTRPALETERTTVHAYSDWAREAPGRTAVHREEAAGHTVEHPIIDVPEVGVPTGGEPSAAPSQPESPEYQGSHRQASGEGGWPPPGSRRPPPERPQPYRARDSRSEPAPPRQGESWSRPWAPEPATPTAHWQPVDAQGEWLPPGASGSNWASGASAHADRAAADDRSVDLSAAFDEPGLRSRHRRYAGPDEPVAEPAAETAARRPYREGRRRADARRRAPDAESFTAPPEAPESAAARHRSADPADADSGPATGGESVADLLARLQAGSTVGPRRRRRRAE